jgi:hypothetical protein
MIYKIIHKYSLIIYTIKDIYNKIVNILYNDEDFYIKKAELYYNLKEYKDITNELKNYNKYFITEKYIKNLFNQYIDYKDKNMRIKIYYVYKKKDYIKYIQNPDDNDVLNGKKFYLKYPLYNDKIIKKYGNNYVYPYYIKTYDIYEKYNLNHRDIDYIKINNKDYTNVRKIKISPSFLSYLCDWYEIRTENIKWCDQN